MNHCPTTEMRSEHTSGAVTAIILLLLLLVLFWDKIFSHVPMGSSTATIGGIPQSEESKLAMLPPDNVPAIVPYNPGPVPDVIFHGYENFPLPTQIMYHPILAPVRISSVAA
jgi:hypothetical protein